MKQIYLDHAAATPVREEVLAVMKPFFSQEFANPNSIHAAGRKARDAVESARESVRKIIRAEKPSEIIFTGSGTESINLAIKGIMRAYHKKGNHIITTKIEHKAVLETCRYLQKHGGCRVTYLNVDREGKVNPRDVEKATSKKTVLITVMSANNEIGTIQPIAEIAALARKHKVLFHTDACQAAGALDLNVQRLGVDLLTLNGSKIYGPKGVGLLYVRTGVRLVPLFHGGGQEFGLRSGTENVPGIVGFAAALEWAEKERFKEAKRLRSLRDHFIERILKEVPQSRSNGHPVQRLPNNVNISFAGVDAEVLVKTLSAEGIYVSAGSACTANSVVVSRVLKAIGVPQEFAFGTIRFSLGKKTTKKELDTVLAALQKNIEIIRKTA
ncbi:cysteine desulfurase [Candidatus Woesearchaeota archaeon]|nr:cysteine desulfurase [Candidatus Woesearchaeota archaeon]